MYWVFPKESQKRKGVMALFSILIIKQSIQQILLGACSDLAIDLSRESNISVRMSFRLQWDDINEK